MYLRIIFLLSLFASNIAFAQLCRVGGSDWLAPIFQKAFSEQVASSGVVLDMHFRGSIPAKQDIQEGSIDVAIIASPKKEDFGPEWKVVPFGFEVALVGVHPENPLSEISYEQLRGVFGMSENVDRWTDLGLTGAWATRTIQPLLPPKNSGATVLFLHDVLGRGDVRPTVRWVDEVGQLEQRLNVDLGAIAVFPYTQKVEAVKMLAVAGKGKEGVSFNPTQENVFYGDYPLRLPLYLVFSSQASKSTQKVIQVLLGEGVASRLAEGGVCPLPKKVRERTLLGLDIKS